MLEVFEEVEKQTQSTLLFLRRAKQEEQNSLSCLLIAFASAVLGALLPLFLGAHARNRLS